MSTKHHVKRCVRSLAAAVSLLLIATPLLHGQTADSSLAEHLVRSCLDRLVSRTSATYGFTQTRHILGHLRRPWATYSRATAGSFSLVDGGSTMYQTDSLWTGKTFLLSHRFLSTGSAAIVDYGEEKPEGLSRSDRRDVLNRSLTLTPAPFLFDALASGFEGHFLRYVRDTTDTVAYVANGGTIVSIAIDRDGKHVVSISRLFNDDMYGDVTVTVAYGDYRQSEIDSSEYPATVVETTAGISSSTVSITRDLSDFDTSRVASLIPATYVLQDDPPKQEISVVRSDYNERIHMLDVMPGNSRSLVLEFNDHLVVLEAALTTAHGEAIIRGAREIAPNKPIRYFAFGHHHPWYLGGVRAMVHEGVTILSPPNDTPYVRQLATFPRTLEPDSQALDPRPLRMETVDTLRVISDGAWEVRMLRIGDMSKHTEDYTIFYFPREKMVFEGDLVWIANGRPLSAAGATQKGLYDAIAQYGLEVDTIMQSWPVGRPSMKTTVTMDELRETVRLADESPVQR